MFGSGLSSVSLFRAVSTVGCENKRVHDGLKRGILPNPVRVSADMVARALGISDTNARFSSHSDASLNEPAVAAQPDESLLLGDLLTQLDTAIGTR